MALSSLRFVNNAKIVAAAENTPSLKQGDQGQAVAIVQMALIDLGFGIPKSTATGKKMPDGIFGTETVSVLKQFQQRSGLTVDGIAGRQTMIALDALIAAQSRKQAAAEAASMRSRPASH